MLKLTLVNLLKMLFVVLIKHDSDTTFANMKKIDRLILAACFSLLGFISILPFAGCGDDHHRELVMIDTLKTMLKETEQNIDIDRQTINLRTEEMSKNFTIVYKFYTDTFDAELGGKMDRYKGILKIYKLFLREEGHINLELAELKKQVETLEKDVKRGKVSKQEFRKYYNTEKADIEANLLLSQRAGKTVQEIEPEYQRLSPIMNLLVQQLAAKNPEVKNWMNP